MWLLFQTKIVRVLNLWQKNNVFPSDVIQPLMDLVSDPNNHEVIDRGTHLAIIYIYERVLKLAT